VAALFALLFPLTTNSGAFTERIVFYFLPASIAACLGTRIVARSCTEWLTRALSNRRDVLIVGSGPQAANLYERFTKPNHGSFRIVGFVNSPNGHALTAEIRRKMLGNLDELEGILMRQPVDEVVIALPAKSCYEQIQAAIKTCERAGVAAKLDVCHMFQVSLARPRFEVDQEMPVVSLKVVPDDYRLLVKRCIDIAGAIAGLAIFGPLMLLIATAIRLTSPGPAFFVQQRYGLNKRRFQMYKFRTMVADAESLQSRLESQNEARGPVFKIKNDPRITTMGRILRKTSFDEFPQFVNVLRGEMSLVGPRPLPARDVSLFDDPALMRRFSVKPGLTCLWQVSGRSNTEFDRWIALDLRYIDQWSLSLDLKIMAMTIPAVLSGKGAA